MKLIFRTLADDLKAIVTNFFAFVVIGGLCLIPCLYAWFNIYSNWDPYGNTGNVRIAVMSEDKGYTNEDGEYFNMGDSVVDNLRTNTKLGWVFVDSREDAEDGVESGNYYAAIVIGETFSQNMFEFIEDGLATPSITYYENSKKNAIASKITQSGKSTLEETINEEFVNTVVTTLVSGADGIFGESDNTIGAIIDDLNELSADLASYEETFDSFMTSNAAIMSSLNYSASLIEQAGEEFSAENIEALKAATNSDVDESIGKITSRLNYIKGDNAQIISSLQDIQDILENSPNADVSEEFEEVNDSLDDLIEQNKDLYDMLVGMANDLTGSAGSTDTSGGSSIIGGTGVTGSDSMQSIAAAVTGIAAVLSSTNSTLTVMSKALTTQMEALSTTTATNSAVVREAVIGMAAQTESTLTRLSEVYDDQIGPVLTQVGTLMTGSIGSIYDSVGAAASNVSYFTTVCEGLAECVSGMNDALSQLGGITSGFSEKIAQITQSLTDVTQGESYETLQKLLSNDASAYGEFFSSPVQVTTVNVYETANYGSSVTPFYTVLAIWVGGILLAALVKTVPDGREYLKGAKEHQLYISRLLLYVILGQIQAVITALGDIYLLKVQCLYPAKFVLISCFTSLVFVTLIFTLTLSFGDVGKALVVVLVVIQIAGSSGTYPIEILPTFFQNVYKYLPFPYAIDAMRECISGMYGNDYWINYIGLIVYFAASLVLGLVARKPFVGLNHFVHKRMHDTQMM